MGRRDGTRFLADFHTHTRGSDGLGTARDLYEAARDLGLDAVAVTDHDSLSEARWCFGFRHHQTQVGDPGPVMVAGVEVSSLIRRGDAAPDVVHILGLGIDPFEDELSALCEELGHARRRELERRLDHARSRNLALVPEAEGRVLAHAFWGKQEMARELVLAQRFETVDEAYHALWDGYVTPTDDGCPVEARRAVEAIHGAGGIAVLAHPLRNEVTRGRVSMAGAIERMDELRDLGLDGVECYYSSFTLEECETLEACARERGMLVSAGSDHHDYGRRRRLGITCADGDNYAVRTDIARALGIS